MNDDKLIETKKAFDYSDYMELCSDISDDIAIKMDNYKVIHCKEEDYYKYDEVTQEMFDNVWDKIEGILSKEIEKYAVSFEDAFCFGEEILYLFPVTISDIKKRVLDSYNAN